MEQDQLLRRDQPLKTNDRAQTALLIAAHGERQPDAGNESVQRITQALAGRGVAGEVAAGFINGRPAIGEALGALTARRIIVYPLFAASGYFTRDRLVQLIDEANTPDRRIEILPPLGLDPGLPDLVIGRLAQVAREHFAAESCAAVLLAHGSRRNPASRQATEAIAQEIASRAAFRDVGVAFLEEKPFLEDTMRSLEGPTVVMGMFSGEGLHGARDAPHLVARLGRGDVVYAGVIGNAPGIEEMIGLTVQAAINGSGSQT